MKSKKKVIGISVGCVCALAVAALAVVLLVSRCGKEDKGVVKASPVTYVVKYESHGGAAVKDGKYTPGEKFVLPTPASGSDPKMYGYSFTSWSYDADGKDTATVPLDEDKAVNGVITLHAGWTNVHNVYFDTRTEETIEPRQYKFGDRIPVADLPRASDRVVGGTPVPYVSWVNASTGQAITEDLRMEGTDMYLYAAYDTGVTSRFELLDDGSYRPMVTGQAAQTTYRDWELKDGQVYSLDMILPSDPSKFNGDAGPVFAATGFNKQASKFYGYDHIWAQILRSHDTQNVNYADKYRGGIRLWEILDAGDGQNGVSKDLGFSLLANANLKGSPYERKMSAYLNGGETDKETAFTFSIRRAGNTWYVGIDGIEYFTVEVGKTKLPKAAKGDTAGVKLENSFSKGLLVGFRSNTMNVRFANISLKDAKSVKQNPANRHTVYFDTKTSQKMNPRSCYPGEMVTLPQCPPRKVQGKDYNFLYWVDEDTGLPVQSNFRMPTCDMHLFAQYDIGTTSKFELLDDGSYRPTVTGTAAQTTYFDWKLNDWQIFSVDMILPSDPSKFDGDAGPVFAATGFNEQASKFYGYDHIWAQILRSHDTKDANYADKYRGGFRLYEMLAVGDGQNSDPKALGLYLLTNANLKGSPYERKMSAYLNGGETDKETAFTFSIRRAGNKWYVGIDGIEYFTVEVGKTVLPKADIAGVKLEDSFSKGLLVGFRSNTMNVRFRNISVTDADPDDYKSTITFETATEGEKIAEQTYFTGETVSASELPKDVKPRVVKHMEYKFDYWIDKETGKKVPDSFTIGKNMTFVAHYDIGVSSAFELLDDGTYAPATGGGLAETLFTKYKLTDGKIFSLDLILPVEPGDFSGDIDLDSGPVFAATGFDEAGVTFKGNYYLWMGMLRMSSANGTTPAEENRGAIRIWGDVEGNEASKAGVNTNLGLYLLENNILKGTPYAKKIAEYKKGGADDVTRTFKLSFRRAGNSLYVGIDGYEYFSVEIGGQVIPKSTSVQAGLASDYKVHGAFSDAFNVGFRAASMNLRIANLKLEDAAGAQPDPANYRTVYFRTNIPSKVDAVKLIPGETLDAAKLSELGGKLTLKIGETECPFIAWAYDGTNVEVSDGINVTVETGNIHIHAVYNITRVTEDTGVNAKFKLQEDGSYKPIGEGDLFESLYSPADVFTDGKVYSVDMIMPENPGDFDGAFDTGPVFATGFNSGGSTFTGNQYLWIGIIRYTVAETNANLRGAIRIWGFIEGETDRQILGYYALTGSALKGSRYSEKMGAYLAGDMRGEEVTFTFSVRRTGNVWNISIDGEQLFTVETGKKLAAANGGEPDGSDLKNREYSISSRYTDATKVGFKASSKNVRFANVRIDDAPAAMRAGLIRPSFADNAFAKRLIFLPVDTDDVIKESFSPVRTNAKTETSGVRTVLLPAKALLARIKAIFRAGF